MRQMQGVLWTKGVLLTPQHLQTQDRFLENLIDFQLNALAFCPWGFRRLTVDREALADGSFAIHQASGIMPDGLLFDFPEADTTPPPKPLEDLWIPDQETLDLFLAIPEARPGGLNVSGPSESRDTRYRAEVELRRDENTGTSEKPIQVARKNFYLLSESESLDGFVTMPVARLRRSGTGEHELDAGFIPPLLDLTASETLEGMSTRLIEILSGKSSSLSATRRHRNQSLAEFGVSDVARFWLLYTVNSYLPQIRHLTAVRRGHPHELYATLLSLAGTLTTFSTTVAPRDLPEYDHNDLSACFAALDRIVRDLLETVIPTNHVSIALEPVRPSVYVGKIEEDRYFEGPGAFLAVRSSLDRDALANKSSLLKVSSPDRVERLISQALPGVELVHAERAPKALPVKLDYEYFRLERGGTDWEAIRSARRVAVYVPSEVPDAEMELVILLPPDS